MHIVKTERGSVAIEGAFFFSVLVFLIIVVTDIAAVMYAKFQLSAALHTASGYVMTGESFPQNDMFPKLPELAVAQKAATVPIVLDPLVYGCYVCYNEHNASCVDKEDACTGQILFAMNYIIARYDVPLIFTYPGIPNPFPLSETVYYPGGR